MRSVVWSETAAFDGEGGRLSREVARYGLAGLVARAAGALRYRLWHSAEDRALDARLKVSTDEQAGPRPARIGSANAIHGADYAPTPARLFRHMLGQIPEALDDFAFVDFGSGRGRVLVLAAGQPFRSVTGVEFASRLHRDAQANIAHCGLVRRARSLHMDAAHYEIPEDPCVLYFYNPFDAPVMRRVLGRIAKSHARNPRPIYLLYYDPAHADLIEQSRLFEEIQPGPLGRLRHAVMGVHPMKLYRMTGPAPGA